MAVLPDNVSRAWDNREGPVVFSTVSEDCIPNSIYASAVSKYSENTIVIANNYFSKTLDNIFAGSKGSILFITKDKKAFQIKGSIEYHKEGPIFEDMKKWNSQKHPGHAAAALKVEEVYQGAEKLL